MTLPIDVLPTAAPAPHVPSKRPTWHRIYFLLAAFDVLWHEAPLAPEDVRGHARLARRSPVRIALGESYRTRFEVLPYFERGAVGVLQPDLGRSGIN